MAARNIKVLYTAALIEDGFEKREQEYLCSLQALKKINKIPYIVEPIRSSSFFDECGVPVFYSKTNDARITNKGINEAIAMFAALNYYQFDDDDLIVKITGRYLFVNDHFFTEIEREPHKDAYVKHRGLHPFPISEIDYFTGCFAMKCKYFKMFLNELDCLEMEKYTIPIEWELGKFLLKHSEVQVHLMDTLQVIAEYWRTGWPPRLY